LVRFYLLCGQTLNYWNQRINIKKKSASSTFVGGGEETIELRTLLLWMLGPQIVCFVMLEQHLFATIEIFPFNLVCNVRLVKGIYIYLVSWVLINIIFLALKKKTGFIWSVYFLFFIVLRGLEDVINKGCIGSGCWWFDVVQTKYSTRVV
jgi:hypothetical protein